MRTELFRLGRLGAAVALAAGVVGGLPATVSAAQPTREFAPLPDQVLTYDCGYEIQLTWPVDREYIKTFYDQDGNLARVIINGSATIVYTNTATGVSLTENAGGPAHYGFKSGGSGEGHTAFNTFVFVGRIDVDNWTFHGHTLVDVCAALAP